MKPLGQAQRTKALLARIGQIESLPVIRLEIIDLMIDCLESIKGPLDEWQKTHFSNAIGALALNIHSLQQPTNAWLRLCLIDFGKAILPMNQRDSDFHSHDASMRDVTKERLVGALDSIGRELAETPQD